jgi:predicted nuclease of restriction endonuclease-like (RecB) superfamily
MCRIERWSVHTLRERIGSQLYLRTALSKQPETVVDAELQKLRSGGQMTPDLVFRDPYMLDFLGLPEGYSERDLEAAILRDMERFLLELGTGFSFVARQKRVSVGADDFYLDKIPDMKLMREQLHRSVLRAREQAAAGALPHVTQENGEEA